MTPSIRNIPHYLEATHCVPSSSSSSSFLSPQMDRRTDGQNPLPSSAVTTARPALPRVPERAGIGMVGCAGGKYNTRVSTVSDPVGTGVYSMQGTGAGGDVLGSGSGVECVWGG